jgi:hypothetical protein
MESLRYEVRGFGIAVCSLEAFYIRTDAADDAVVPAPVGAYTPWRDVCVRSFAKGVRHGHDPDVVARAVRDLIENPHPPLVRRVDRQSRALPVLRALLPQRVWDGAFSASRRAAGGARRSR